MCRAVRCGRCGGVAVCDHPCEICTFFFLYYSPIVIIVIVLRVAIVLLSMNSTGIRIAAKQAVGLAEFGVKLGMDILLFDL